MKKIKTDSLYINKDRMNPGSPPDSRSHITELLRKNGVTEANFGPTYLKSIGDRGIGDQAHRLLCLIAALSWKKPCIGTAQDFADFFGWSKRVIYKHIASLSEYINIEKGSNNCNRYSLKPAGRMLVQEEVKTKPQPRFPCVEVNCGKLALKLSPRGFCGDCAAKHNLAKRVLGARSVLGPSATEDDIAIYLKTKPLSLKVRDIMREIEARKKDTSINPRASFRSGDPLS